MLRIQGFKQNAQRPLCRAGGLLALVIGFIPVSPAQDRPEAPTALAALVLEMLTKNPALQAATARAQAAQARINPAGTLDDPMFETGIVNAPLSACPIQANEPCERRWRKPPRTPAC
jgi:hypothetical protein